jgi:hypothetical protein
MVQNMQRQLNKPQSLENTNPWASGEIFMLLGAFLGMEGGMATVLRTFAPDFQNPWPRVPAPNSEIFEFLQQPLVAVKTVAPSQDTRVCLTHIKTNMAQVKGLDNPAVLESAAHIWTTTGDKEKIPIWLDCDTGKLKYQL